MSFPVRCTSASHLARDTWVEVQGPIVRRNLHGTASPYVEAEEIRFVPARTVHTCCYESPRLLDNHGLIVLVNFLLIGMALGLTWRNQDDVEPTSVSPVDGAGDVSARSVLRVTFNRPMDPASVRQRAYLDPPAPGTLEISGSDVLFTPRGSLAGNTRYSFVMPAGTREQSGRTTQRGLRLSFTTRSARLLVQRGGASAHSLWVVDTGYTDRTALDRCLGECFRRCPLARWRRAGLRRPA